jgi:hypothetical protein
LPKTLRFLSKYRQPFVSIPMRDFQYYQYLIVHLPIVGKPSCYR